MSGELSLLDFEPTMENAKSTTPGSSPIPGAEKHEKLDIAPYLAKDPTTNERPSNSASPTAPTIPFELPSPKQSSGQSRRSSRAIERTEPTSSSGPTPTTGAIQHDASDKPNISSAPEQGTPRRSPLNTQASPEVKEWNAPQAQDSQTQYVDPNDYEKRFPEDEMGEETAPNARVWRTYLAESSAFDDNMIGEARDGLDALLVFAGLFSGVVTSFVVQTSQSLKQASTDVSAALLFELIAVQRAAANGTPVSLVPPSPLTPDSNFVPDTLDVWVNSLWFISLALNLIVALGAVLVKQWLHRYVARRSGSPKEQSHMRQYHFDGFEQWQVLAITGWLPVIMHFSLAVFSAGLVLFLNPLQVALSWTLAAIAGVVYMLYVATNFLPVVLPQCPYQTPLSDFLCSFLKPVVQGFKDVKAHAHMDDVVSVNALEWLLGACFNPSTRSVGLQAIGGLPRSVMNNIGNKYDAYPKEILRLLRLSCAPNLNPSVELEYHSRPAMERTVERLLRSYLSTSRSRPVSSAYWRDLAQLHRISFPTQNNDLRYMLTSIAFNALDAEGVGERKSLASDCLQAILSYSHVRHHPVVWMTIIHNAMRFDVFSEYATRPNLVQQLLPLFVWYSPQTRTTRQTHTGLDEPSNLCTMVQAIYHRFRWDFCDHLLSKYSLDLEKVDQYPSIHQASKTCTDLKAGVVARVLMITMELALQQISTPTVPLDGRRAHWDNIGYVLSQFHDYEGYEWQIDDSAILVPFFRHFMEHLIQVTDICETHPMGSEVILSHRQLVIDVYLKTRSGYSKFLTFTRSHSFLDRIGQFRPFYRKSQHIDPPVRESPRSEFTSLRRAVEGSLCDIPNTTTIDPNVAYAPILDVIGLALQGNCATAYELIAQYDCLHILHRYGSKAHHLFGNELCPRSHLSRHFITGLVNNVVDGVVKERCNQYLITHLRRFTILWIAESVCEIELGAIGLQTKALVGLFPRRDLADDLCSWLTAVLTWLEDDKSPDTFSAFQLGDESIHEFLVTAFRFLGYDQYKYRRYVQSTMQLVIEALTESKAATEPISTTDTDAFPHPDNKEGKFFRSCQKMLWWRGAAQEAPSAV